MQTRHTLHSISTAVRIALVLWSTTSCTKGDSVSAPGVDSIDLTAAPSPIKIEVVEPIPDVGSTRPSSPKAEECIGTDNAKPKVFWNSLRVAEVSQHLPGTLSVVVPADRTYSDGSMADVAQFRPLDPRVPIKMRSLRFHLISPSLPTILDEPTAIKLIPSMYDGDYWSLEYSVEATQAPMVAVDQLATQQLRLRSPAEFASADIDDDLVTIAASTTPRPKILNRPGMQVEIQVTKGMFPKCADRLVVVNWTNPLEHETESVMFTIDRQDKVVQDTKLISEDGIPGRTVVNFLGDLDGDGYDEVGWTSYWIESWATRVTRFRPEGIKRKELSAWGH